MSDEKNVSPQQKEYMDKLKNAKVVLDAVNQQRKQSIEGLRRSNQSLQDNEKMTMESLGTAAAVDIVRTMSTALNASFQALESHDKIIDMLNNDLVGSMNQVRKMQEALYELSASEETALRAMMKKSLLTEDELRAAYTELVSEVKTQTSCGDCKSDCNACPSSPSVPV
jgi:hypothetical protein